MQKNKIMATAKRKLIVFDQISLDGFYKGENDDLSWAHHDRNDEEWNSFVRGNATGDGTLIFGRKTYEMMVSFWPTEMAKMHDPVMAERMNKLDKVVFSKKLKKVNWENTKLLNVDAVDAIRKLKSENGTELVVLGSGNLVAQFAEAGLIDELQIVIFPVALGKGKPLFAGMNDHQNFKLKSSRTFTNGNVFLSYEKV